MWRFPFLQCSTLWISALLLHVGLTSACAQQPTGTKQNINGNWWFTKAGFDPAKPQGTTTNWQAITVPHTWNISDVMDDTPGYYRGACWYRKDLRLDATYQGKFLSLQFEGANQQTTVYVNGKKAGTHQGGYTAFVVPVSPFLKPFNPTSNNTILVCVDNRFNEAIPPLTADFTFYGGIYRDVWLLATGTAHFDRSEGSDGVLMTTPVVDSSKATVVFKSRLTNSNVQPQKIRLTTVVKDKAGTVIAKRRSDCLLAPGDVKEMVQEINTFNRPHLWSPDDPFLYQVTSTITQVSTGKVLDETKNPLGFRWFNFHPDSGFFLNGKPAKLLGTSRHQDYPGLGNAMPDSLARRDLLLLKAMGANFLRVAHYPQDPSVLQLCDSLGLLTSVEIPVVNEITESEVFYRNCEAMQREMIRQNFNHPSVVLWCYMNEVLLKPHFQEDAKKQKNYIANITQLAKRLDSLTRKEDPYRPTMIAHHGDLNKYADAGLVDIPSVVGWNLYSGWYGPDTSGFPKFLDNFHRRFPQKPMLVTEYGADADPRIHSNNPVRFDKSVEYATLFHRFYLKEIRKRPFVAGGVVWNLADFNSESRTESMPHINNKGLLAWDRTPKDPYHFYRAALGRHPLTKILASQQNRTGITERDNGCLQPLMVASNSDSVELFQNRVSLGKKAVTDFLAEWLVPFVNGKNEFVALGTGVQRNSSDTASVLFTLQRPNLSASGAAFVPLNILLGSSRYFIDSNQQLWQPSVAYRPGSWGSVGGSAYRMEGNSRLPYGSDRDIGHTTDDPIFQTQLTGIRQYRLDVQPGTYTLTLYFAELEGEPVLSLPYNLVSAVHTEKGGRRIFNVSVNNQRVIDHLNLSDDHGIAKPVSKTITVTTKNNEGIVIDFEPITGEPVLNALQVKRRLKP